MNHVSILSEAEMVERRVRSGRPSRPAVPYSLLFPVSLVQHAEVHLGENGARGLEQVVLWGGYVTAGGVVLTSLLLPETEAEPFWVRILPSEQPLIASWLRQHGQLLFVESHTHGDGPFATELSAEDRRHPAGRQDGFLTLIVTGYARHGIDFSRAGVWECRELVYRRLEAADVARRLRVVEDKEARDALV